VIATSVLPSDGVTFEAAVVVAGAIVAVIGVAVFAALLPRRAARSQSPPRPSGHSRPSQLLRIERIVERSRASRVATHTQLRPLVLEIAETRLARRGLRLDRDGDEARRLLGPQAWELVRPDRPEPPADRAVGIAPRDLEAMLDRLEAL
jgi:hypothetical protein